VKYQIDAKVLSALHNERVYQNRKWGSIADHPHEVGAWLTVLRKVLADAERAWCTNRGDYNALDEIRQLTAVGIACMEQHGPVPRSPMAFVALQNGEVPHSVEGE
jgi:hypothetical protein